MKVFDPERRVMGPIVSTGVKYGTKRAFTAYDNARARYFGTPEKQFAGAA
jgi:hypothetical protein